MRRVLCSSELLVFSTIGQCARYAPCILPRYLRCFSAVLFWVRLWGTSLPNHARVGQRRIFPRKQARFKLFLKSRIANRKSNNKNNKRKPNQKRARPNRRKGTSNRIVPAKVVVEARRQPQSRSRRRPGKKISGCALKWAISIADPWSKAALRACVPIGGRDSQKVCSYVRTTCFIGTQGFGFCLVSPTIINNLHMMFYTGATYAQSSAIVLSGNNAFQAGVETTFNRNCPYSWDDLNVEKNSARIVSCGLRLRYTGKEINRAGLMYLLRSQHHRSVQYYDNNPDGTGSPTSWGADAHCHIEPNDRRWHVVCDHAARREEMEMDSIIEEAKDNATTFCYPFSNGQTAWYNPVTNAFYTYDAGGLPTVGTPTFGVLFTGTPGESIEIEYIQHSEYAGRIMQHAMTGVPADPQGAEKVMTAANHTQLARKGLSPGSSWNVLQNELSKELKSAEDVIVPKLFESAAAAVAAF